MNSFLGYLGGKRIINYTGDEKVPRNNLVILKGKKAK